MMRKRPLQSYQSNDSCNNVQQDQWFIIPLNQPKEKHSPPPKSKRSLNRCEHSSSKSSPPPPPLVPISRYLPTAASALVTTDINDHNNNSGSVCEGNRMRISSHSFSNALPLSGPNDRNRRIVRAISIRLDGIRDKLQKWNDHAMRTSPHYEYIFYKSKPLLFKCCNLLRIIIRLIFSIKLLLLCYIVVYTSFYVYFIKMPMWELDKYWLKWEVAMQNSVADLIPPLLPLNSYGTSQSIGDDWSSNSRQLEQFPYLKQMVGNPQQPASEYIVPMPDYDLMGRVRGELAQKLHQHATQSCQIYKHQNHQNNNSTKHSLPVMGITVANDTPENRYLRRLLHTTDLNTVGSIVITWYDEQTEAQLVGQQKVGLSHEVVADTLKEYIICKRFTEISWRDGLGSNRTNTESILQLADATSLKLMAQIATSIQQFCIFDHDQICRSELLILRFSTNLGCSSGVNNPLFTHPTAPHWLIVNYDIAYPPGVLDAMGRELQKSRNQMPDLAVHTFGYIYGRGKIENPWSNFVMSSCAVAKVGLWDENIFPAYYEDDDFRDRIRYILGEWYDVIGDPDRHRDVPQRLMNDTHLIRYMTDRNVSVAHGPLSANKYLSGTHETMKKVQDEEKRTLIGSLLRLLRAKPKKAQNPFHYESHRWSIARGVSDSGGFFRCKHGALPNSGQDGKDPIRYFGYHERFLLPFVNRTRVTRWMESTHQINGTGRVAAEKQLEHEGIEMNDDSNNLSPWTVWNFNATRKKCVHNAVNILVSMTRSKEREDLEEKFRESCSVCEIGDMNYWRI